jgi:phosphonoacetate hydrolase
VDLATGAETYMESPEHLCFPSVLERASKVGLSTAALTAKQKLLRMVGAGTDYSLSAERPDPDIVASVGPVEDIYSPKVNLWLFRALRTVLRERDPDLVYCATTDGMMHKHAPKAPESVEHVQGIDSILGDIVADNPDREVYLTADHGMSEKRQGVDLESALDDIGIESRAIPIIKDRYVVHHGNLGGAAYVYLQEPEQSDAAMGALQAVPGVEEVYTRADAATAFSLMPERIGHLFVLADATTVF